MPNIDIPRLSRDSAGLHVQVEKIDFSLLRSLFDSMMLYLAGAGAVDWSLKGQFVGVM